MREIFIASLLACIAFTPAAAGAPCAAATAPADDLIERASAIVLAQAVGDEPIQTDKTPGLREVQDKAKDSSAAPPDRTKVFLPIQLFEAIEYVKGDGPAQFSVTTAVAPANNKANYKPDHENTTFLNDANAGRGVVTETCSVAADFEPGARYLIFIGETHVKAYEEIASDDDPWLAYVKAAVSR